MLQKRRFLGEEQISIESKGRRASLNVVNQNRFPLIVHIPLKGILHSSHLPTSFQKNIHRSHFGKSNVENFVVYSFSQW